MSFWDGFLKKKTEVVDKSCLPVHIAIIMDGNGRWAKRRGLSRSFGHREGANTLKRVVRACDDLGIKFLTVYAFSTENWKRPKSEVDTLMSLLIEYLKNADRELAGSNVRIRVLGDRQGLSEEMQKEIVRLEKSTEKNPGLCLNIALNYGGRAEIVHAARLLAQEASRSGIRPSDITEEEVSKRLYTAGMPDPDLLIRPGGEMRISNYLLWQCAYAELWFTEVLWPDFSKKHILEAVEEFQKRNRRFGGV